METVTTAASTDESTAPETTEEVILVEEVSIDGMCGVY
ncbi:MAG: mycofactocin precursor MftA [Antricoccus sp.]